MFYLLIITGYCVLKIYIIKTSHDFGGDEDNQLVTQ